MNLRKLNKVTVQPDDLAVAGTGALFQDLINAVGSAKRELSKFNPTLRIFTQAR